MKTLLNGIQSLLVCAAATLGLNLTLNLTAAPENPTFSDANWSSMGGIPGANGPIYTVVADGMGNLYIGGKFTIVGDVFATNIAKWNGTRWSALGSGLSGIVGGFSFGSVHALAVSGNEVYAGGFFIMAGGSPATNIAKWNGSSWSALGSGMGPLFPGTVYALAVSGSDVYAGGEFTTAGDTTANGIAKWDGSSWSALGSGMSDGDPKFGTEVHALTVSGGDVYAGGRFTTAGDNPATNIAIWNGKSWSALGSGIVGGDFESGPPVLALAVIGGDVYAGGYFGDGRRQCGQ